MLGEGLGEDAALGSQEPRGFWRQRESSDDQEQVALGDFGEVWP